MPDGTLPPMRAAATRRSALLRYITGYMAAHDGVAPMLSECAAAMGTCKSAVFRDLVALEVRGAIRRLHRRHRAIEVTTYVAIPRAPDGAPLWAVPIALRSAP